MFHISGLDMDIAVSAIRRENYFPKASRNLEESERRWVEGE